MIRKAPLKSQLEGPIRSYTNDRVAQVSLLRWEAQKLQPTQISPEKFALWLDFLEGVVLFRAGTA
jgi:hypothetical protein